MDAGKKYYCKCGVAFTSERSLNFHRGSRACRLREPSAIKFSCSDCKFTAYYQITLEKHRQIRHSSKTPYACKCGEKFGDLDALIKHQEVAIPCKKYHTCKICGHISPTQGQLNRHFRSHSDEKPFVCACGRAYPRKDSYYRHQRACPSGNDTTNSAVAASPRLPPTLMELPAAKFTPGIAQIPANKESSFSPSIPSSSVSPSADSSSDLQSGAPRDEKLPTMLPPPSTLPHYTRDPHVFPNTQARAGIPAPPAPAQGALPPLVQVHSQVFMPHYSGHFVWMNPTPAHPQTEPAPQTNQLMNLSYLASMKRRIDLPVPSNDDVPSLE